MPKVDTSSYRTVDEISDRLDEIVGQVRDKGTSLERSLDLFDEAIALGSKAVDLVDTAEPSARELAQGPSDEETSLGQDGAAADGSR